ncbi:MULTISPECIES: permease [unclassified Fusibacter]|uniref:permease n=1 Tax=unclassified Fusibacter TaxID=2624464 RepID=UPI0010123228|nr:MULTISPECIES: permease [unclassified Fusibacter]MCK8060033.1 permease [Fusibacter sp. A2]NPE22173.1 permease [Fusibacter sp. A1]RXV60949.1 permease [Fusibacter sp. A1]
MMNLIKTYKAFIVFAFINLLLFVFSRDIGITAARNTVDNFGEMLKVLPPIFLLIGLFDVWVPRETLIRYMGEGSGIKGMLLAFFMGSFTAGPLYAAFPVATILMKKGSKFSNVLIFIGAWSSTKLPLILFETSNLGLKFTLTRFMMNLVGITLMAFAIEWLTGKEEKERVYESANAA